MITKTKEVHRSAKTKRRKFLFTLWTSHRRTFNHQRNRTNLSRGYCQFKRKLHRKTTITTSTTTMYKRISLDIQTAASLLFRRIQVLHVSDDPLNESIGISSHRVTCEWEAILFERERKAKRDLLYLLAISWSKTTSSDWWGEDDGDPNWPSWYRLRIINLIEAIKSINVSKQMEFSVLRARRLGLFSWQKGKQWYPWQLWKS